MPCTSFNIKTHPPQKVAIPAFLTPWFPPLTESPVLWLRPQLRVVGMKRPVRSWGGGGSLGRDIHHLPLHFSCGACTPQRPTDALFPCVKYR